MACSSTGTTISLKIRTMDSRTHTLQVNKHVSISALKEQIKNLIGVLPALQRLLYLGKQLVDDQLLSYYRVWHIWIFSLWLAKCRKINFAPDIEEGSNIKDGCTMHLVVRQPVASSGNTVNFRQPVASSGNTVNFRQPVASSGNTVNFRQPFASSGNISADLQLASGIDGEGHGNNYSSSSDVSSPSSDENLSTLPSTLEIVMQFFPLTRRRRGPRAPIPSSVVPIPLPVTGIAAEAEPQEDPTSDRDSDIDPLAQSTTDALGRTDDLTPAARPTRRSTRMRSCPRRFID